jgi:uncharacterized membrane protein YdjX (TVP38/TMEM64 family)
MRSVKLKHSYKIVLAILALSLFYLGIILILRAIGLQNAQSWLQQTGAWAPAVFIVLCAVSLIVAPFSGSSLFVVGGTLFGQEASFLLGYFASVLGCSINFWISRKLGHHFVARFVGKASLHQLNKLTQRLKSHREILYMMIVMLFFQDIVSYAVGLTRIKYRNFLIALLTSGAVVVAGYTYLGSSVLEALVN